MFLQRFAARLKLRDDRQPLSDAELNKAIRAARVARLVEIGVGMRPRHIGDQPRQMLDVGG